MTSTFILDGLASWAILWLAWRAFRAAVLDYADDNRDWLFALRIGFVLAGMFLAGGAIWLK